MVPSAATIVSRNWAKQKARCAGTLDQLSKGSGCCLTQCMPTCLSCHLSLNGKNSRPFSLCNPPRYISGSPEGGSNPLLALADQLSCTYPVVLQDVVRPLSKRVCTQLFHRPMNWSPEHTLVHVGTRAGIVTGDPFSKSRKREENSHAIWRRKQDVLGRSGATTGPSFALSSPILFRDYSGRGERQVNSPAPIGAGVGRSPLSERLVRHQQGIGGSGMGLKRGNLVPAPQLDNSCKET